MIRIQYLHYKISQTYMEQKKKKKRNGQNYESTWYYLQPDTGDIRRFPPRSSSHISKISCRVNLRANLDFLLPKVHQLITNCPRSFPYRAEASSGWGFSGAYKARENRWIFVSGIGSNILRALFNILTNDDTIRHESYILHPLFLRSFTGFGIGLAVSTSRRLRQRGGQPSRRDRSPPTLRRVVVPESGQRDRNHCGELARGMGPEPGRIGQLRGGWYSVSATARQEWA